MVQLTLFNSEELYEFPKDLLEFREHFLNREEADLLKISCYILHRGNSVLRKCMKKW
ncbi:hypothetical protein [Flavobacterium sp. B17]|uniref:hypothetical protein n=1 Tax=Flavobacterium sp. B17 TaxID=95618 RepID=UPI0003452348|nr:hypothetical protein [Flavobacterium sp. B17]